MKQLNLFEMSSQAHTLSPPVQQGSGLQKPPVRASRSAPDSPVHATSEEHPYTVSKLNALIRKELDNSFKAVWLKGEVSNFTRHSSGHFYFSLKDEGAELRAVMFRPVASKLEFQPQNGLECIVKGQVTLYPIRGTTQIVCSKMVPCGEGALQQAFEQLKTRLQKEALFERKRPLPRFPRRIAVISSPTGAAIQDVLKVLKRRNPMVPVVLIPSRVQGEAAAEDLLQAIERAHGLSDVDVLLVTRGGGSIEDLWCFNDERVARALAASPKIVVSAVGHEIDYTICDFVADHRAPTPSAAAEIVVPDGEHLVQSVAQLQSALQSRLRYLFAGWKQQEHNLQKRLNAYKPLRRVQDFMQRRDELAQSLERGVVRHLKSERQQLEGLHVRLQQGAQQGLLGFQSTWQQFNSRLSVLNPARVLQRGFSVVQREGRVVTSAQQLKPGENIAVRFARGHLAARVTQVRN